MANLSSAKIAAVPHAFLNRSDELEMLASRWDRGGQEVFVLWGRRRVGKTDLLAHFAEGKRALYFEATAGKEVDHLDDVSGLLAELSGDPVLAEQPLNSWPAVLAAVARDVSQHGQLLLVLDEFQYVARETPEVGSLINRWLRRQVQDAPLFLVFSGSDVSFFQKEIMGYSGSMYGRRTGSHLLAPFGASDVRLFVPEWSPEDIVRTYGVFGGMPYYLSAIDPDTDLEENIYQAVLAPGAVLRDEPTFLFSQEGRIRDSRPYFSILRALAAGRTKNSEVAARVTSGDSSAATQLLDTLLEMGLVRKEFPVTVPNPERSKQSRYVIDDPFLRFWFRFVMPHQARLRTTETARRHLDAYILPRLDEFVSLSGFESFCRRWLLREEADAAAVGRWWGKVREATSEGPRSVDREADIMAIDGEGHVIALGSCKWTNHPHGDAERMKLERIAQKVCRDGENPVYYFFSRCGFTADLESASGRDAARCRLVTVDDLFR